MEYISAGILRVSTPSMLQPMAMIITGSSRYAYNASDIEVCQWLLFNVIRVVSCLCGPVLIDY